MINNSATERVKGFSVFSPIYSKLSFEYLSHKLFSLAQNEAYNHYHFQIIIVYVFSLLLFQKVNF